MPNQNQPDPNQQKPVSPTQIGTSIPFSPQADLPPLPPEFQTIETQTKEEQPKQTAGSASPPKPEFANITSKPKKKFGTGKIIATILGITVLLGGVIAGVLTTQQKQVSQKASAGCSGCGVAPDPLPSFNAPPTQVGPFPNAGKLIIYSNGIGSSGPITLNITSHSGTQDVSLTLGGNNRLVTDIAIDAGESITINKIDEGDEGLAPGVPSPACAPVAGPPYYALGWIPVNSDSTCGTGVLGPPTGGQCTPMGKPSVASVLSWINSQSDGQVIGQQCWGDWREWPGDYDFEDYFLAYATLTEGASASPQCSAISTYDIEWNLITNDNRSDLVAGDVIYFCVNGSAASGTFDKARFTINGTTLEPITEKRPDSEDFCQRYTIPEGVTTFNVTGEIHHLETDTWVNQ